MFSGIAAGTGTLAGIETTAAGRRLTIDTGDVGTGFLADAAVGASIACSGVCLTATALDGAVFEADAGPETLALTTIGDWQAGRRINLERSLKLGDEVGGHLVLGHVDGIGGVQAATAGDGGTLTLAVEAPAALLPLIAKKGSIAVDGVSLTVNAVGPDHFTLGLIPHTLAVTALQDLAVGDTVNLEVDMMARYAARLLEFSTR